MTKGIREVPAFFLSLFSIIFFLSSCGHGPAGRADPSLQTPSEDGGIKAPPSGRGSLPIMDEDAYFAIGNAHLRLKRHKEAESSYIQAIRLDPKRPEFHNNLAWAYMEQGMYEEAEEAVRKAIDLDKDRPYIYLDTQAVISLKAGDLKRAINLLKRAFELVPQQEVQGKIEILNHLLQAYDIKGDRENAGDVQERLKGLSER
jgi:tetratricopeptide (TPR) repeat protein